MELWTVVLSSTVVSTLISALVGGWFGLRSKQNEYANAYYKMILERRIAAYEEIETLIATIKTAVVGVDKRPYHMLFSEEDGHSKVWATLHKGMGQALWLTDDLFQTTRELNLLVYGGTSDNSNLIEFGKNKYIEIGELRTKLERLHARDLIELHDVKGFLKAKKPANTYGVLPSRG